MHFHARSTFSFALTLAAPIGCNGPGGPSVGDSESGDLEIGDPDSPTNSTPDILEVYYGLDALPAAASVLCGGPVGGQDGVPVTFSIQLEGGSVAPEDFVVETAAGEQVIPDCATLASADEPLVRLPRRSQPGD